MAVTVSMAQKVLAYAIGHDPRLKPPSNDDATAMVMAWADALPAWTTVDLTREALALRANDSRTAPFALTLPELTQFLQAALKNRQRRERHAQGSYTTLPASRAIEPGDKPIPMPPDIKARLQRLFTK